MAKKVAKKLDTFMYQGKNPRGEIIKGEVTAPNLSLAKAQIKKLELKNVKISKKGFIETLFEPKPNPMDMAIFFRQMAVMMKAGVPLLQSFDLVIEGSDSPAIKKLVGQVGRDVGNGLSFTEALSKNPAVFDELTVSLIGAGEQSGALEALLDRVATYKEKSESLKTKVKGAMKYPIGVLCVAGIVSAILLIKVVPQFESVFKSFGSELPAFTQMVVRLSEYMQEYWWVVLGGIVAFFYVLSFILKSSKKARDIKDRIVLKIPIVGDIIYKSAVARFARTLATTFAAGVPLVEALDSVAGAAGNDVFFVAIKKIQKEISTGTQLNVSMRGTKVFPALAVAMTSIGEESGALDGMMERVANLYEEEVDVMVDSLTDLMEPLIMAVLGVLVGGLVIAMYLPIFSMGSIVK